MWNFKNTCQFSIYPRNQDDYVDIFCFVLLVLKKLKKYSHLHL
ncbi:MAG: hypothetical protein K2J47_11035 [Ruminococcus sp.]|nr:hypothetical protein [Ruminococcus sp.]